MLDLKLDEVDLFESLSGISWTKAAKKLKEGVCRTHRLSLQSCRDCVATKTICEKHDAQFQDCAECEGMPLPAKAVGALAFVYERRGGGTETFEQFNARINYVDMLAIVGNALGGEATANSRQPSPRSSTTSRGLRTTRSGRSR